VPAVIPIVPHHHLLWNDWLAGGGADRFNQRHHLNLCMKIRGSTNFITQMIDPKAAICIGQF